jgi:hypothetical protein
MSLQPTLKPQPQSNLLAAPLNHRVGCPILRSSEGWEKLSAYPSKQASRSLAPIFHSSFLRSSEVPSPASPSECSPLKLIRGPAPEKTRPRNRTCVSHDRRHSRAASPRGETLATTDARGPASSRPGNYLRLERRQTEFLCGRHPRRRSTRQPAQRLALYLRPDLGIRRAKYLGGPRLPRRLPSELLRAGNPQLSRVSSGRRQLRHLLLLG